MMTTFFALIKKELLEIVRSRKLLVLIIIFLFIAISSPIFAKLIPTLFKTIPGSNIELNIPDATWRDAIDQLVKNISQIGMIVIIFMFAGSVAEEKNKKTLELVLAKPVSRSSFVLAKFLSSFVAVKSVYLFSLIIFYLYTVSILGSFSLLNFVWLSLCLLVLLLFIVTITIFSSTIASNQITAAGLSFALEIVIVAILSNITKIEKYTPGYILSHYKDLMQDGKAIDFWPSAAVSIGLILILIYLSIVSFSKQEIER